MVTRPISRYGITPFLRLPIPLDISGPIRMLVDHWLQYSQAYMYTGL